MSGVQISLSDFPDDIIEPMTPILEAIGLVEGGSEQLDLDGWTLDKALSFITSYQRTTAILSILDFIESIPIPKTMYRDADGHVTDTSSDGSTAETWYSLVNFNHIGKNINFGVSLHREKKSDLLPDGTNCQIAFIGLFAGIKGIEVGSTSLLDLDLSLPFIRIESMPNGTVSKKMLLTENAELDEDSYSSLSIQARLYPDASGSNPVVLGDPNAAHCDAITLRLAIGRPGVDIELNLDNYVGGASAVPQDLDLSLMQAGQGFNPDYNQLLDILISAIPSGSISEHLLPLLGLDANKAPSIPELGLVNLLMGMNSPMDAVNGVKSWALGIIQDSTIFEAWIRHFAALFTGSDSVPSYLQGDGTEAVPWEVSFPLPSLDGEFVIRLWTTTAADGTFWINAGLDANVSIGFNDVGGVDQSSIDFVLNMDIFSYPLIGSGSAQTLQSGFLGVEIHAKDGKLLEWFKDSVPLSIENVLGNFTGSVGSIRAGLSIDQNRSVQPDLCMVGVIVDGSTPRDIDLLSGGLAGHLVDLLTDPFRNAISDILANDPYLQRIGAIMGLVCPRNNGTGYNVRNHWEDTLDFRIGGVNQNIGISDFLSDPIATIGRYHRALLETSSLTNVLAGTDLETVRPWSLILEAVMDLAHSIASEIGGGSAIPIREDGSCDIVQSTNGSTETYTVDITSGDSFPQFQLEVDYDSGLFSLHPIISLPEIPLGKTLELEIGIIVDLFSIDLPDPAVADSVGGQAHWLEGARLEATLQAQMQPDSSTRPDIPILSMAAMDMSIQSINAGLEWVAPTDVQGSQFGYYFDVVDFQFGGSFPDLSAFMNGLPAGFDFGNLSGLSWDGIDLRLPDLSFIRFRGFNLEWFESDGTTRNWNGIGPITIPGVSISLPDIDIGSFSGWNLSLNLRSLDGTFNLRSILLDFFPDFDTNWDLNSFLSSIQIRSLIGKFLSLRCGRLGLFLAGFFRIDPHFPMFDLGQMLRGNGFEMPKFNLPNLPEAWKLSLGMNSNSLGMGPFSLPFDWPEINWNLLLTNPFEALKAFFIDLFNGQSKSGQPFALPALRWFWGLFSASLPDLRLPDFGWGNSSKSGSGWTGFNWNGLNWGGLNWPNLNWNGINWGDLNWDGFNFSGLDTSGINWKQLDWGSLDWHLLNWDQLNWSALDWQSLNWRQLNWQGLDWGALNWGDLGWDRLVSDDTAWTGFDWSGFDWSTLNWSGLGWTMLKWDNIDWGQFLGGFSGFKIELPSIPLTLTGAGTYEDPWAIGLQKEGFPAVEILVWLDPDGPPRIEGLVEVFHSLSDEVLDLLDNVLASNSPELPSDWASSIAQMLLQLSVYDGKASHAIGNMPQHQIARNLLGFEYFMRSSDGLLGLASQQDWGTVAQTNPHEAHHLNSLRTTSIINEAVGFLNSVAGSIPWKVLFVSPSWMTSTAWDDMVQGFVTAHAGSSALEVTDLSAVSGQTVSQIGMTDKSGHDASSRFHLLMPSLHIPTGGSYSDYLDAQVSAMVDHLTDGTACKVFLIGHSVGGLAVRYYADGGPDIQFDGSSVNRDTKVMGALTVSTPHGQDVLHETGAGAAVLQIMQLLRLIGSVDPANPPAFDPAAFTSIVANASGEVNLTPEIIEQLSHLLLEAGMKTYNAGVSI